MPPLHLTNGDSMLAGLREAGVEGETATPVDRRTPVTIAAGGRHTLAGERDHVTEDGIDRWIGGVHLEGRSVPRRWDEGVEAVVRMS